MHIFFPVNMIEYNTRNYTIYIYSLIIITVMYRRMFVRSDQYVFIHFIFKTCFLKYWQMSTREFILFSYHPCTTNDKYHKHFKILANINTTVVVR